MRALGTIFGLLVGILLGRAVVNVLLTRAPGDDPDTVIGRLRLIFFLVVLAGGLLGFVVAHLRRRRRRRRPTGPDPGV